MDQNIDISFIIPLYNKKITDFERCLKSIHLPSGISYEIIVINDGSENKYKKSYEEITYKYNGKYFFQENKGVSAARNKGIKEARGNYISFVDADDVLIAKNFSLNDWINFPDVIIYSVSLIKDKEEKIYSVDSKRITTVNQLFPMLLSDGILNWSVGKLYSTAFLKENQICFDPVRKSAEDFDFIYNVLSQKPTVKIVNKVIYQYLFNYSNGINRLKKYPLENLNDSLNSFYIRKSIIERDNTLSKKDRDALLTKLSNYSIRVVFDIYSSVINVNTYKKEKIFPQFKSAVSSIMKIGRLSLSSKIKINLILHRSKRIIKVRAIVQKIYFKIKGKN